MRFFCSLKKLSLMVEQNYSLLCLTPIRLSSDILLYVSLTESMHVSICGPST